MVAAFGTGVCGQLAGSRCAFVAGTTGTAQYPFEPQTGEFRGCVFALDRSGIGRLTATAAAFRAVFNISPAVGPFFAPGEGTATNGADFLRQVGFTDSLGHGLPKNVGLKPRPNASGTATPRGRLYAILKQEARVVNLSKNPVAT